MVSAHHLFDSDEFRVVPAFSVIDDGLIGCVGLDVCGLVLSLSSDARNDTEAADGGEMAGRIS